MLSNALAGNILTNTMNTYTFKVQFGNGKPQHLAIKSKSLMAAIAQGEKENPGAFNFHLVEVNTPNKPKPKPKDPVQEEHPLFGKPINYRCLCPPETQEKFEQAISMRWKGMTYVQIAKQLHVSRNTVSLWFKHYV